MTPERKEQLRKEMAQEYQKILDAEQEERRQTRQLRKIMKDPELSKVAGERVMERIDQEIDRANSASDGQPSAQEPPK